jgi:hypothetical protein
MNSTNHGEHAYRVMAYTVIFQSTFLRLTRSHFPHCSRHFAHRPIHRIVGTSLLSICVSLDVSHRSAIDDVCSYQFRPELLTITIQSTTATMSAINPMPSVDPPQPTQSSWEQLKFLWNIVSIVIGLALLYLSHRTYLRIRYRHTPQ